MAFLSLGLRLLLVVIIVAVSVTDAQTPTKKPVNVTSWTYLGCETGSVDAPDDGAVYVWFRLSQAGDDADDERVIPIRAVPAWSVNDSGDGDRGLVCNEDVFLVDPVVSALTLYNRTQAYGCDDDGDDDGGLLCQALIDKGVPCSYDQNGVLSDGRCRNETNAAKCEVELFGQSITIIDGKNVVDTASSPLLGVLSPSGDAMTLQDAGANVTLRRASNVQGERLSPLAEWPSSTTIVAGENDGESLEFEHYSILFDVPRFGRSYVLTTEERVLNQAGGGAPTIGTRSYVTRAQRPSPSVTYQDVHLTAVSVEWTGTVTYQAMVILDTDAPCQLYTSPPAIEFRVDAPWYAKTAGEYEACPLCVGDRGGVGQDVNTNGASPLRHAVTETTGHQYSHSCESLFIAGARGRVPPDRCPVVQAYPCCVADDEKKPSSSGRAPASSSASVVLTMLLGTSGFWLLLVTLSL